MEDITDSTTIEQTDPAAMLAARMEAGLVGHAVLVERLMIALLTGGHVLIEGAPGLAKTRSVRRLADGVEGSFARIQCTPDLMPSDVTGTQIYRQDSGAMEFLPGPVFHNLVLVDEINRAPPKVQSALLEAMGEGQVTAGGRTRPLPDPFMVIATQNPLEQEGTFPLPEAQLDRFLMHVVLDLPDEAAEMEILDLVETELRTHAGRDAPTLDHATLAAMQEEVLQVHLSPALKHYMVALVMATRGASDAVDLTDRIRHAVSPRGTLALASSARARAWLHGRDYAVPEDIVALAPDVLCHRMAPTWRAQAEGHTSRTILAEILSAVPPL
ncbi:AAA family ATPase [Roseovarius atlanticus]|uniref:AAA family ATPase n=1 Tax=Roseovarius atlanticus TaxID=1641875 RepID=UPI001C94B9D3|nr:AAA family ATPase [Roseovarius atlanticus]MBY6126863.1 AAA family ATPase [Roseovarius atlanticus]MBY6151356.1 AAA family ATPase [Roseovarius atlanticus]